MEGYTLDILLYDQISLIINIWGNIFLLVMIFSLYISKNHDKKSISTRIITIPYTDEILTFYYLIFFYNLFFVIITLSEYFLSEYKKTVYLGATFMYYVVAALLTVLFLIFVKKYIADKFKDKLLSGMIYVFTIILILLIILLVINVFTGCIYYYDDELGYQHNWGYYVWQSCTLSAFVLTTLYTLRWMKVDGRWYYFNSDGYILTSTYIGEYWVNADGAWE